MDRKDKKRIRRERMGRLLEKPWAAYTAALCIAVLFYMLLSHLGFLVDGIKNIFSILSPVIIGVVMAYILNPLVNVNEKYVLKKIKKDTRRHMAAVVLAVVSFLVVFVVLIILLVPSVGDSVANIAANAKDYEVTLQKYLDNGETFLAKIGLDASVLNEKLEEWISSATEYVVNNLDVIFSTTVSVGSGVVNFFIGFIMMIYILISKDALINGINRFRRAWMSEETCEKHNEFLNRSNKIFIRFIVLDILDAAIIGVLNAIFMLIAKMPYVAFISVAIAVTNLVPTFGPIVGGAVCALILLLTGHPWMMLAFVIFSIVLQTADSYIIKPKLYGEGFGISGLAILIAIIVFGSLFGVIGMLVAVPLAAIITIVYHEYVLVTMEEKRDERALKFRTELEAEKAEHKTE